MGNGYQYFKKSVRSSVTVC